MVTEREKGGEALIGLTSDIVVAYVSNNNLAVEDVAVLLTDVYTALSGFAAETVTDVIAKEPAVSIRASVRPDYVACLECGKKMMMIKRHLITEHNLTVDEYRGRWGLPLDHPMVAPNYSTRRADIAKKLGFGRELNEQVKVAASVSKIKVASKTACEPTRKVRSVMG